VGGDAALYFDPTREDDIIHTLRHLLDDADLQDELVRRGLERAAQFSWDRVAAETEAVYRAAMETD
jgi:glycosyltransferase involved in cell wall biosynthesis